MAVSMHGPCRWIRPCRGTELLGQSPTPRLRPNPRSVYLFGKKHRPDLTINDDGIAIEIKYLSGSLDGLKQAIGQSIFYRVRYRFVMNVFVIAEKYKDTYLKGANEEEKDLEEIFQDLSTDMNIFSYIVPAFTPGPNVKALLAWNDIDS